MSRDTFLSSVTVLDTETTNLHPEQAEIVEIAAARYDGQNWTVSSRLLGSREPIPPEASAKNHISQRMINGKPLFEDVTDEISSMLEWKGASYFVAHNCPYDQTVLAKSWLECGRQQDAGRSESRSNWICTYRLAKQLLRFDFKDMQYNLSYLRYKLDLPVNDDLPSHRADADTLICAVLFEFLVDYALAMQMITDGPDIGDQVHHLCWRPLTITTWLFGKNKNKPLSEIPDDYYAWALQNMDALNEDKPGFDPDLAASVAAELERRFDQ